MLYTGRTKDGYKFVGSDPETGKLSGNEFVLDEAQLRQMASASVLGLAGYGKESLERLGAVSKDMRDHISAWNSAATASAASENDALHKGSQDRVAQQNANTSAYNAQTSRLGVNSLAAYREAKVAGGGSGGGSGGTLKPVKMDVVTADPVTGKPVKVQVLMNPNTGEAITADGKPFTDSAALDRARGQMGEDAQLDAAEAQELRMLDDFAKNGRLEPAPGESLLQALNRSRAEVRHTFQSQRAARAFAAQEPQEQQATIVAMARNMDPAGIPALLGVSPQTVKTALQGAAPPKAKGLIREKSAPSAAAPANDKRAKVKEAYEAWQNAKTPALTIAGPGAEQREAALRKVYEDLLRTQYVK